MNDQSRGLRGELKIYLLHQEQPQFSYESADDVPLSLKIRNTVFLLWGQ